MRPDAVSNDIVLLPPVEKSQSYKIKYELATSQSMIEQYYGLLESVFQLRFDKNFQISLRERVVNDMYGQIIVALDSDNKVVGGARIILSTPKDRCQLPLESPAVVLNCLLPELELNKKIYAEWGRFVRDPSLTQGSRIAENISRIAVTVASELGCEYLFAMPNVFMRNRYEKIFIEMGLEFKQAISPAKMPRHITFPTIPVYVAAIKLDKLKVSQLSLMASDEQLQSLCA